MTQGLLFYVDGTTYFYRLIGQIASSYLFLKQVTHPSLETEGCAHVYDRVPFNMGIKCDSFQIVNWQKLDLGLAMQILRQKKKSTSLKITVENHMLN